jgi:hypothetical protein
MDVGSRVLDAELFGNPSLELLRIPLRSSLWRVRQPGLHFGALFYRELRRMTRTVLVLQSPFESTFLEPIEPSSRWSNEECRTGR